MPRANDSVHVPPRPAKRGHPYSKHVVPLSSDDKAGDNLLSSPISTSPNTKTDLYGTPSRRHLAPRRSVSLPSPASLARGSSPAPKDNNPSKSSSESSPRATPSTARNSTHGNDAIAPDTSAELPFLDHPREPDAEPGYDDLPPDAYEGKASLLGRLHDLVGASTYVTFLLLVRQFLRDDLDADVLLRRARLLMHGDEDAWCTFRGAVTSPAALRALFAEDLLVPVDSDFGYLHSVRASTPVSE